MKQLCPNVFAVNWNEVHDKVSHANSELAKIINACKPAHQQTFVLASYGYGEDFLTPNDFFLPNQENSSEALTKLNYGQMPLGIILNKVVEVYYETSKRIVSDKVFHKGSILGAWELFDSVVNKNTTELSYLSAGARSTFILPKVSDKVEHARLCKQLKITVPPPLQLRQHRDVFTNIIKNKSNQWRCEILYFSDSFVHAITENPKFYPIKEYLFNALWGQSYNCRQQFELNVSMEDKLEYLRQKNIHIKPYLLSHIKQIISVAQGVFPGLRFAKSNDLNFAPINTIQEAYKVHYRLKNYEPILMIPDHIDHKNPVYYSLNFPSYFEPMLPSSSDKRIMDDLKTIAQVFSVLKDWNYQPSFEFDIYHSNANGLNKIKSSTMLVDEDKILKSLFKNIDKQRFAYTSPFFKGCLQIRA